MENATENAPKNRFHECVFSGPAVGLMKVLESVVPSIAETNIRVHFIYDPLASLQKGAQSALNTLEAARTEQSLERNPTENHASSSALDSMRNILHSMVNNMRTIDDISAYRVHWHVTLRNFMEMIPKQSLLMRTVMKSACIFPLDGDRSQSWSSRPFKNHGIPIEPLPTGVLEPIIMFKSHPDPNQSEQIVVKLRDQTGLDVSKYYFEKVPGDTGCVSFVKEERQAHVCLSYLEGVTSNVVLGLVGELNVPFTLDRNHQSLLDSREKVHVVVLAEYLGLNQINSPEIYNECGIRIDFNCKSCETIS